jgi:hypothetical protein
MAGSNAAMIPGRQDRARRVVHGPHSEPKLELPERDGMTRVQFPRRPAPGIWMKGRRV